MVDGQWLMKLIGQRTMGASIGKPKHKRGFMIRAAHSG